MYGPAVSHTDLHYTQWPRCCNQGIYNMRIIYTTDYDDATGKLLHSILEGESYTLTGEYFWELIWRINITSDISDNRLNMLKLALSHVLVCETSIQEWLDG